MDSEQKAAPKGTLARLSWPPGWGGAFDNPAIGTFAPLVAGAIVLAAYLAACWTYGGSAPGTGVWLWWDQSKYYLSAEAFARGDLTAASHHYAPGYSLLAAPFQKILPWNPFLAANIASFVACLALIMQIARRLEIHAAVALILFGLTTVWSGPLAQNWVIPWTTTPSAAVIYAAIAVTLIWLDTRQRSLLAMLGALLGLLLFFRPSDLIIAAPLMAFVLPRALLRSGLRHGLGDAAAIGVGFAVPLLLLLALHLAIYGWHLSPYLETSRQIGFAPLRLVTKWIVLVVTPLPLFGEGRGITQVLPWTVLGIAGVILFGMLRPRLKPALVAAVVATYCALYLTYTDLQPSGLWNYLNIHYFKAMFPLLALLAFLWCRALLQRSSVGYALGALLIALLAISFRLEPSGRSGEEARDGERKFTVAFSQPTWLDGIEVPLSAGTTETFHVAPHRVEVDGRDLLFLGDFRGHMIPGGGRLHFFRGIRASTVVVTLGEGNVIAQDRRIVPFINRFKFRWP